MKTLFLICSAILVATSVNAHDVRPKTAALPATNPPSRLARTKSPAVGSSVLSVPTTNVVVIYRAPTNSVERAMVKAKNRERLRRAGINEAVVDSLSRSIDWSKAAEIPVATNKVVVAPSAKE